MTEDITANKVICVMGSFQKSVVGIRHRPDANDAKFFVVVRRRSLPSLPP